MAKDLVGRTMIVTGANSGIGRATAVGLARRGARVHLACRSREKTEPVLDAIRGEGGDAAFLSLDLSDLAATRRAADAFLATGEPLHVLVNNAGVAGRKELTKDGFELAFGTNHMGTFVFTEALLPRLRASAPARIVILASGEHRAARGLDFDAVRRPGTSTIALDEYRVSKLANVLHARALARRLAGSGVTTYAVHPGVVATDVWRELPPAFARFIKLFMRGEEQGASTSIHCATDAAAGETSGLYWQSSKVVAPSKLALDDALGEELFRFSEAWSARVLGGSPATSVVTG